MSLCGATVSKLLDAGWPREPTFEELYNAIPKIDRKRPNWTLVISTKHIMRFGSVIPQTIVGYKYANLVEPAEEGEDLDETLAAFWLRLKADGAI